VKKSKIAMGAMALLLPVVLIGSIGVSGAWAKKAPVAQPGTLTCSTITGTLTFNPPLSATGATSGTETTAIKVAVKGCTSGSATVKPKSGKVSTSQVTNGGNSCTGLAKPSTTAETLTTAWSPKTIAATTISFPGYTPVTSPTVGFQLGGTGTTGSAGSSYLGSDSGKTSTAKVLTGDTSTQFLATCDKSGIKTLKITSGTVTLQ
jgi:hypothetical protein